MAGYHLGELLRLHAQKTGDEMCRSDVRISIDMWLAVLQNGGERAEAVGRRQQSQELEGWLTGWGELDRVDVKADSPWPDDVTLVC